MNRVSTITAFLENNIHWKKELLVLIDLLDQSKLTLKFKWGAPTYTLENKNVIGIGAFKSYVGIWFFQGAFLNDKSNKLVNASEGKTKGMRQWRFTSIHDMDAALIEEYINEAIVNQEQGKEIKRDLSTAFTMPETLLNAFSDKTFRDSFHKLTPGKQKEYAQHINEAKQESTKLRRVQKAIPLILEGKGLHDKYR